MRRSSLSFDEFAYTADRIPLVFFQTLDLPTRSRARRWHPSVVQRHVKAIWKLVNIYG